LERRKILTAAPSSLRFIVHRTRFSDDAPGYTRRLQERIKKNKYPPFGEYFCLDYNAIFDTGCIGLQKLHFVQPTEN
jgi:hypothetical protein